MYADMSKDFKDEIILIFDGTIAALRLSVLNVCICIWMRHFFHFVPLMISHRNRKREGEKNVSSARRSPLYPVFAELRRASHNRNAQSLCHLFIFRLLAKLLHLIKLSLQRRTEK